MAALADFEAAGLPRSIVHGDHWPGNVLFHGRRLTALVDGEETSLGTPIFDLAYLALHGCLSDGAFDAPRFAALIRSYRSIRELSPAERRHFQQALRCVACSNYLWLLLKEQPDPGELEGHWIAQ